MTTGALDAANAATVVAPVRLIRVDFPGGVTIGWSTAPGELVRDGLAFATVNDTYGTLLGDEDIETSLDEIGNLTLAINATPALVALLEDVTKTRARVRIWDVARDLDTGALIDTDAADFDGFAILPEVQFGPAGASVRWQLTGRSARRDDPRGPARWDAATQALMTGDTADRGFEYVGNLPDTLPWGSGVSNLSAPARAPSTFTEPGGTPPANFDFSLIP